MPSSASDTIHFQNGTIINAHQSIARPLSIAKQGKDLTSQLAEDIAEEMAENPDDPELKALLDATHEHMLSWAQFDITCADFKSVVSEVQEMASHDEIRQITDLEALMNPKFDRVANDTKAESELKKTDCWKDYIAKVNEIVDPEGLQQGKQTSGGKGGDDDDDDESDDDMLITQAEVNLNCPITRKPMVKPMKNKICNHTYDQEGIDMLLAQRPSFKCPVPACSNNESVFQKDLEVDRRMLRIIKSKQKN